VGKTLVLATDTGIDGGFHIRIHSTVEQPAGDFDLVVLDAEEAKLIVQAADEVIAGTLNAQFPLRI